MIIDIIYEDKNIIVCVKPYGIPSQKDPGTSQDMTSILSAHTKGGIFVVHRLDRVVGGIMVYAKNKYTAAELSQSKLKKEYFAVVCGSIKEKNSLTDYLLKNGRLNISKVVNKNSKGAKKSILEYEPVQTINNNTYTLTLLKVNLITGRHHQIRVQLSNAGFPIYADTKYNKDFLRKRPKENIALFSHSLEINGKRFFADPFGGVFELFDFIPARK